LPDNSPVVTGLDATQLEEAGRNPAEKHLPTAGASLIQRSDTFTAVEGVRRPAIPLPGWLEGLGVMLILGSSLVFQALYMFHAPYSGAEGTLMANTEAILRGKITPYAYDFSLPPLGWILLAGWVKLTGGIASFGNAINSGRVLMLVMAGASSLLLY